jgi:hypothetical protein
MRKRGGGLRPGGAHGHVERAGERADPKAPRTTAAYGSSSQHTNDFHRWFVSDAHGVTRGATDFSSLVARAVRGGS